MVQSLFRNATFRAANGESRKYIDYSYLIAIAGDGVSLARSRSHKNLITRTHRHHQPYNHATTPDTGNRDCNSQGNVYNACAIYNAVLVDFDSAYEQIIRSANCFLMQILFANPPIVELLPFQIFRLI